MKKSTIAFILGYLVLNIIIAPYLGLPNILQVLKWPFQMAWYYGWTYPWYLFSNNFGTLMWLGLGLLFLFSIPVVGPIMRKIAWWIWVNLFWRIIKFPFKRWKEGRKKKGLRARYRAIRGAYFAMLLRDAARNIIRNTPGFRNRYIKIKNIAGREPEIVFRNRILFMRLLDQELRFDIFYTKFLYMNEFHHKIIEKTSKTHGFLNQQDLKKLILVLRSQKGKIPFELINPDGTRVPIEVGEGGDQERIPPYLPYSKYKNFIGWNYLNQAIIMYMNHLIEFFKIQIELAKKIRKTGGDLESFYKELIGIAQSKITTDVAKIEGQIKVSKEQFDDRLKDYTPHYTIRAHTLNMWDMFNSSGKAYHTYRFAKRGAKHIYKDKDGRTLKTVTGEIEEGEVNDDHTQVNVYGEFAEDVRKGTWPIRKLRNPKEDTIPFPPGENMGEIAEYYVRDWSGFIRDFRSGLRHPGSRNVAEYVAEGTGAWALGIWKDNDIPWAPKGGSEASPAFDLRVLANPGIYSWQGKRRYNSPETDVPEENMEPHISQYGIKTFILRLIDKTSASVKETKEFLEQVYPADTGKESGDIKEMKGGGWAVGRFSDKGGHQ